MGVLTLPGCYANPVPSKEARKSPGLGRGKGKGGRRLCPECGSPFRRTKQTVCPDCRNRDRREFCEFCGEPNPPGAKRYCSRTCSGRASLAVFHADPEHQSMAGKAGGKRERPISRNTYRKENGRHIHRIVAETVLGRPLCRGEVVHHEDEDKWNNHPFNLIVFPSQAVHAGHHKLNHLGSPCDCPGIRLKEVMPHESLD